MIKETDEILHVSTSDGETIDTTTNHPFYVEDKGWVAAGDLEIGDILVTAGGDEVEVTDIEIEKLAEPILVYNLEVEDFHTYFVGEYGVLVHNSGCYRAVFEEYTGRAPTGEVHHGLPQEEALQKIFKSLDIDINDGKYLYDIPKENHTLKIGQGIHTNCSKAGMTWNAAWKKFFNDNVGPYTKKQIEDQLDVLTELFEIGIFRATPKK